MGFHEIVKHSQLIVIVCLGIFSLCIVIAGAVMAGYLTAAGISSIAAFGYAVLAVGVILLIVSVITFVGHTKGSKVLQTVSTILFGLLALIFVLLFIFCFAFQTNAAQYLARDCDQEYCVNPESVDYCWKTTIVSEDGLDGPCPVLVTADDEGCPDIGQCAMYIYYQSNLDLLADLSSRFDECTTDIKQLKADVNNGQTIISTNSSTAEVCQNFYNAYISAESFYGTDYESWSADAISYLDTTGYACALAFIFCVVQVGAAYYISQTDSELQ
jgi:hypothetical protein